MIAVDSAIGTAASYFQPLESSRWSELVQKHPRSSVFHTVQWLEALRRTYGYEPIVVTTSPPGSELQNGLVFCKVNSWLTGRRLVSLPFSDHCDPLVDNEDETDMVLSALERRLRKEQLLYVEFRPVRAIAAGVDRFQSTYQYHLHQLDLTPDLGTLFRNCHKNSTQRKIRRAQKEGLVYEEGRSKTHLDIFYDLLLLTRRRHQVPPPPRKWFENLIHCFGESLTIRVALKGKQPIASILTMRHKDTLLYKYGCSVAHFHELGGVHLLLWRSIAEAKQQGLRWIDLGRSDFENTGLTTFKDRWGGARSTLLYSRFAATSKGCFVQAGHDWKKRAAQSVFFRLPDRALTSVGEMIYKHIG
jgi:lipid II:glycine glycyltransferase (peptidoglycan interpeptide bridge formation enzyme)